MALSCDIKDRIFTFNGKDYNHNEFRALMYDGLLERIPELTSVAKETLATEEGKAKEKKPSKKEQLRQRLMGKTPIAEKTEGEQSAEKVADFLKESNIDVEVVDDVEFNEKANQRNIDGDADGLFLVDNDTGTILLNRSKVASDIGRVVVFHEGIHPVINIIRNTNPKLYQAIVKGLNEEAKKNSAVAQTIADVAESELYQKQGKLAVEDETIVETLARAAAGEIDIDVFEPTLREKFIEFMNKLAKIFGLGPVAVNSPRVEFKRLADQLTAALNEGGRISDIVGKENVAAFQNTVSQNIIAQAAVKKFGKTGITKKPILDKDYFIEQLKDGRLKVLTPTESIGNNKFMLTFPDDLFVGEIFVGKTLVAKFGGGVIYAVVEGDKGRLWASVNEDTAKAFAENVNRAIAASKDGVGRIVLVKGVDTKHATSLQAKVGFIKTLLNYTLSNAQYQKQILDAVSEAYTIDASLGVKDVISQLDEYMESTRSESGQTMKEAADSYSVFRSALVKIANPLLADIATKAGYKDNVFNTVQLKKGNKVAKNDFVDTLFADFLQEDFLAGLPAGSAYAVLKVTEPVTYEKDTSHPSYPWVIRTKNGSPVNVDLLSHSFMTYGPNEAILGRSEMPKEGPSKAFGNASYTLPSYTLKSELSVESSGAVNLQKKLKKYKVVSKGVATTQASKGIKREKRYSVEQAKELLSNAEYTSIQSALSLLAKYPKYLNNVAKVIMTQRKKLLAGKMPIRDVAKSYIMTQGSIGSDFRYMETLEKDVLEAGLTWKSGTHDISLFAEDGKIRPEELTAWWLGTPLGKRALDNLEKGIVDEEAFNQLEAIRKSYGKNNFRLNSVLGNRKKAGFEYGAKPEKSGQYNLANIAELTAAINETKGDLTKLEDVLSRVNGISEGKKGFIGHMLGIGDMPTIDAVELNFWLTGDGAAKITSLSGLKAATITAIRENVSALNETLYKEISGRIKELSERVNELYPNAKIPAEAMQHVLHHWIWDRARGSETTHKGMYTALAQYSKSIKRGAVPQEVYDSSIESAMDALDENKLSEMSEEQAAESISVAAIKAMEGLNWYKSLDEDGQANAKKGMRSMVYKALDVKVPAEKKAKTKEETGSREIPEGADEDVSNIITVARRRLEKIQGDPARAEERDAIFGYEEAYKTDQEYRLAIDQGRNYVAELYFKYADLPPVEWAKAVYADVQSVTNGVSRVVAYGELHAALDMYAGSKKLSAKARKEIANLRAKMVMDMAIKARQMGQMNAALNEVYSQYGKFAQLVIAQKIDLEFKGKLESQEGSEKGKTIADDIQQAKEEVEEFLDKEENKEIKEVVDLAEDVNDAMEDIHAAKVAAGESTPLDAPTPVSASKLIGDPKIYDEIITELEDEIKRLDGLLAGVNKLYSSAAANAASYAQQVADLTKEINNKNRLIGKLKKQKDKIAAERDTYKKQAAALEKKVNDLKAINKLLAKNKLSPKKKASLVAKLVQLAGAGKLNDPDFDSVFAAITGGNYLTTQDRKAIEHMAKAMEYFAGIRYRIDDKSAIPAQKEMGEKYAKRLNQYLEQVSREPKSAVKWMIIFQSWFYNAVLSGISTLQNAFVGSVLTGIPNAVMNSIAMSAKNPSTAIGANIYGMMRMLKEMPTAFSKGMFNQSAYDSMGTSWTVENASTYADPFEVHILNGFFKQWNRVKNDPTALGKTKGALMLLASASAQATRITALLKFIDPVLRHSLAAHMEGMQDYIKLKNEMRGMVKDGTADPSIVEAWTPFISKKLFNKIDEMAGVAMKDRTEAAKEAQEEIDQMESDGVSIPRDYLRRRTSEIMRAKRDAEMTNAVDQMSADMIMMWRPDGVLGYVWDKSSKKMAISERDSFVSALGKLALNLSILPFLRITAQGVSEIQSTIPIIGYAAAKYGLAKKANGEWKWGSKTSDAQSPEFANMQMGRRVALNVLSTMIIAGLFINTFEVEDADDDDEAEDVYDLFGKKVRIKMDPDRVFDFTADARGSKSKNQGIMEGRSNFSIRFRFGKDDEWSDWTSVRLSPHMTIPVAWLGRISDDVNKLYAEPVVGRGRIPKKAEFYEYFTDSPLTAMGEVSFATIPRLWSTFKYDAGAGFARMFMSPVAAIAQPAIYRDVVSTAASMAGATKKGEYMPEGFLGTSKALFSSIYGLNHIVSNEMTDEYGLPFESIDPIRNFWKNYTSIDERSDDYPEVNLRWKYANTFIEATPRAQRIEKVQRMLGEGEPLAGRSAEIELTKDEQFKSSLLTKAIYRNRVLKEYENIISKAEQEKKTSGKNSAAAEQVEDELNKAHRYAAGQSEWAFSTYKSGKIKLDEIVKTIDSLNAKSKEMSDRIKSRGLGPAAQEIEKYERSKK